MTCRTTFLYTGIYLLAFWQICRCRTSHPSIIYSLNFFYKNEQVWTFHIDLVPVNPYITDKELTAVTAKVFGQIAGIMVPFPLTNSDACSCGVTCPTKAGTSYKYKYSLPIASEYPSVSKILYVTACTHIRLLAHLSTLLHARKLGRGDTY